MTGKLLSYNYLFLVLISFFLLPSCSKDDVPSGPAERTVLVYMVANNSLSGASVYDLEEMEAGAANLPADARWIVYEAPKNGNPVLKELKRGGKWQVLKNYDKEQLSVSAARMEDVLSTTRLMAPARNYGLVLWSHASGWPDYGLFEPGITPQSFGDDDKQTMNITTLGYVLEKYPMEFIYADCCNMAGVEVAYELRNCAKLFVGSAIELPGAGMQYTVTMPMLLRGDVTGAAKATFEHYKNDQSEYYPFCTLSVTDLGMMNQLAKATKDVFETSTGYPAGYSPALLGTGNTIYFDLKHFIDAFDSEKVQEWNKIFEKTVIYSNHLPFINGTKNRIKAHNGLSTFIQTTTFDAERYNYNRLQWYGDVARFQPF